MLLQCYVLSSLCNMNDCSRVIDADEHYSCGYISRHLFLQCYKHEVVEINGVANNL